MLKSYLISYGIDLTVKLTGNKISELYGIYVVNSYHFGLNVEHCVCHNIMLLYCKLFYLAYVQQIGRGGRDGVMSSAILYFNALDIGRKVTAMDDEILKYCISQICLRQMIANYFMYELDFSQHMHLFCSFCQSCCVCDDCKKNVNL